MPKKTTILIAILAIVTLVLLFLAVSSDSIKPLNPTKNPTPTKKEVQKTAKVFFAPTTLDLSTVGTSVPTVDLMIDTGNAEIAGVQAELIYDPAMIASVVLTPAVDDGSFFGTSAVVLFNDIIPQNGRISYAIAISPDLQPKKGVGKIATLTFQKTFNATGVSTVSFLNKTLVTVLGENESVLKETIPLSITLTQPGVSQAPFVPVTTSAPISPAQ